jgi:hypothetical protein
MSKAKKTPYAGLRTYISIPAKLHEKIAKAAERLGISSFNSLFKILMTTCVSKYLHAHNYTFAKQNYTGIQTIEVCTEQIPAWKEIIEKSKEIKVPATHILVIMMEKEMEEYESNKKLTLESV